MAQHADPSYRYVAITKSDTVNFDSGDPGVSNACRAIYVGGAGTVVAVRTDGTAVTFAGVPAGTTLPIVAIRVNSTNTTATSMVALH